MTIDDLKAQNLILLECISGSRAYGLDTPTSDTDIKGVFYLPKAQFYCLPMNYIPQINNASNDVVYYELGRFIELLLQNNPNIMELLNTPPDKILYKNPLMNLINPKDFISKLCHKTFAGFAHSQIKKARGLNKKIVNPMGKDKKSVLDFCYVLQAGGSVPLTYWLNKHELNQTQLGLSQLPHTTQMYAVYIDKHNQHGFSGVIQKENATGISLSSIPKSLMVDAYLSFNQMGYSKYCQDYHDYWQWVENRNDERYQSTLNHGKNYDAKNLMHTMRLLQMAKDIANKGEVVVHRTNRDELLTIKSGQFDYDTLIAMADTLNQEIDKDFANSNLPDVPDRDKAIGVLNQIRLALYNN